MLLVADLEGFCKFDKLHMSLLCHTSWSYLAILMLDIYYVSHNRCGSQNGAQYPRHRNIKCL